MSSNVITEWFRHVPEEKWLRDPAQSKKDARGIWDTLGLTEGVRVLECPCGKADLGFPLARLGASVTGVEFNAHFITAAKNKFFRAGTTRILSSTGGVPSGISAMRETPSFSRILRQRSRRAVSFSLKSRTP